MNEYQYKLTRCEYKYKEIGCKGKEIPEFQGQLAQQLVGVNGVVLVAEKLLNMNLLQKRLKPGGRESRNSGSGSPSLGDPLAPSSIRKEST